MQYTDKDRPDNFTPPAAAEDVSKEALAQSYYHLYDQYRQLQHDFHQLTEAYEATQVEYTESSLFDVLESSPEIILSINRQHEVTMMNSACEKHFAELYHVHIKTGDSLDSIFDEDEQIYWHPIFAAVFEGNFQKSVLQKNVNGKISYLETMLYPMYTGQDTINYISVYCKDITESQLTEQAIRENEQNLSEAHKIARSGSWEYHVKEQKVTLGKETIILFALPDPGEKVTLPIEEILLNFIYPDDLPYFVCKLSAAMQYLNQPEKYQDYFEYRFVRPDGEIRHLVLYAHFKNNQPDTIYGVTRDVTEQKEIEKRLIEQNQELTKVNNEIDRFVYRVSHDLRAPIASILGLINIARYETCLDKIMEYLTLQEKSMLKMDGFIQEIIDFSKNSRLQISKDPIDFKLLVSKVFEAQSHTPNVQLVALQSTINQTGVLISDQHRIYVIFNSIVMNAIRYANLKQKKPWVKITVSVSPKEVVVTVKDNGIGIHEKHLNHIFDMFYRANDINPGSGLGLYVAKETAQKLGGHITLSSTLGEGTCFNIVLPNLDTHSYS